MKQHYGWRGEDTNNGRIFIRFPADIADFRRYQRFDLRVSAKSAGNI
jgi:hypothetical protein